MRLTSSGAYSRPAPVPRMPPGLVELMDGLARDVLMHNPTNLYEFCANHMEKLLEIRDGPSSKKSLTLEQKIEKAQEKMRQKAQERREIFDREMKLLSNGDIIDSKTPVSVILEDPLVAGPNLRAPVHHEVDLKNSSEVEISHIAQIEKIPVIKFMDNSNTEVIGISKEEPRNVIIDNAMGAETQSDKIISDEKYEQETNTDTNKIVDDESIFGKVEIEVINVESLEEHKQKEIVDIATIESPLQTIEEASEENFVNSGVILPKITIGDDGDHPDNISDIFQQADQSNGSNNKNLEHSTNKSSETHKEFKNDKSSNILDLDGNKETRPIIPPEPENSEKDYGDNTSSKNEILTYDNDKTSEIINDKNCSNLAIPLLVQNSDIKDSHDNSLANDTTNKDTIMDKQLTAQVSIENLNISENKTDSYANKNEGKLTGETDTENGDMSTQTKVVVKVETDSQHKKNTTEDKAETNEQNISTENKDDIKAETNEQNISTEKKADTKAETDGQHESVTIEKKADKTETDSQHGENKAEIKVETTVQTVKNKAEIESETAVQPVENKAEIKVETAVQPVIITTENTADVKVESEIQPVIMTTENKVGIVAEHIKTENKADIKAETEQIAENTVNSTEINAEQINLTEYHNTNINEKNLDTVKIEPEIIQQSIKSSEINLTNDFENHHDIEISLQKSDSAENTNEDSISMVESDQSKTDDDSTKNDSNMDLETAAVTIQNVFRSFMFKSRSSTFEDTANDSVDEENDKKEEYYAAANLNKERRPLGITRMDTVLQTVNEEKSLSLSTDDSSTLSSAATTIQAHVRGFLVRNRLNSSKTYSMNSLVNSHEVLESDEQYKNKTILNIHIVPEEGNYLSRDESLITSMDLSLDGSPQSSVNLHPLSCDISERRKMLKREDAVQSVSPPSNNSGKLSEDSVKEVFINENSVLEIESTDDKTIETDDLNNELDNEVNDVISSDSTATPITVITISKSEDPVRSPRDNTDVGLQRNVSLTKLSSDEADVVTPYVPSPRSSDDDTKLVHSGEFHDVVLPTKVSRNDTSTVREFKNVLVYFLLWNHS